MPLGGSWHRKSGIEILPVLTPTLIVSELHPDFNDFAIPGEYLVLEGMVAYKITHHQLQTYFICDETPELDIPVVGMRDHP